MAIGTCNLASAPNEQAWLGWVLSPEPCDARRALAGRLAQENRPLVVAAEIEHAGLQIGLVREGFGLGLASRRFLGRQQPDGIKEVDVIEGGLRLDVLLLRSPHLGAMRKVSDAVASEIRDFIAET